MRIERNLISDAIRSIVDNDKDYLEIVWQIEEFNEAFEVKPNPELYAKLVIEETREWTHELLKYGWTENLLKETIDILYVLEGLLAALPNPNEEFIIDDDYFAMDLLDELNTISTMVASFSDHYYHPKIISKAFKKVHESNMSKLGDDGKPIRREDKKVMKGPNYKPADLSKLIATREEMLQ